MSFIRAILRRLQTDTNNSRPLSDRFRSLSVLHTFTQVQKIKRAWPRRVRKHHTHIQTHTETGSFVEFVLAYIDLMPDNLTYARARTHTHTHMYMMWHSDARYIHTHSHVHTHTLTHAHAHEHTHTVCVCACANALIGLDVIQMIRLDTTQILKCMYLY